MRKMQGGECDNNGRRGTQRTVLARYIEIDIYVVIFNLRILTSINAISALILYYFKLLENFRLYKRTAHALWLLRKQKLSMIFVVITIANRKLSSKKSPPNTNINENAKSRC